MEGEQDPGLDTVAWVVCPECTAVCTDLERHTASLHTTTPEEGTTDGL